MGALSAGVYDVPGAVREYTVTQGNVQMGMMLRQQGLEERFLGYAVSGPAKGELFRKELEAIYLVMPSMSARLKIWRFFFCA